MSGLEVARKLAESEATIERGLATFVEVGSALLTIRDGRLYREQHGTFEDYCRERWGVTSRRANQLIGAAEIAGQLGTIVPTNEAQARELARIPAEQRAEFWQRVTEEHGERVTAAHVRQIADTAQGKGRNHDVTALRVIPRNGADRFSIEAAERERLKSEALSAAHNACTIIDGARSRVMAIIETRRGFHDGNNAFPDLEDQEDWARAIDSAAAIINAIGAAFPGALADHEGGRGDGVG